MLPYGTDWSRPFLIIGGSDLGYYLKYVKPSKLYLAKPSCLIWFLSVKSPYIALAQGIAWPCLRNLGHSVLDSGNENIQR